MFFAWPVRDGEHSEPNPIERVDRPRLTKRAKPPFFDDDEMARLLKTCNGQSFEDRRVTALLRILMDTGMRVFGLAGLRHDPEDEDANDVFLPQRRLRITLKGGDEIWVRVGKKAAAALDRYMRIRAWHARADSPWLWP